MSPVLQRGAGGNVERRLSEGIPSFRRRRAALTASRSRNPYSSFILRPSSFPVWGTVCAGGRPAATDLEFMRAFHTPRSGGRRALDGYGHGYRDWDVSNPSEWGTVRAVDEPPGRLHCATEGIRYFTTRSSCVPRRVSVVLIHPSSFNLNPFLCGGRCAHLGAGIDADDWRSDVSNPSERGDGARSTR